MRSTRKSTLPILLSAIFSLAIIAYVIFQLDWQEVKRILLGLNWNWVILAFSVHVVNYILRTLRLQLLLPLKKISFLQLFGLNGLYGMYNYLLPVGTGEATLVALLKFRLQISVADGLASLIAARYFDFSAIALIIPLVLIFSRDHLPPWAVYASLIFCVSVLLVSFFLFYFLQTDSMFSWRIFISEKSLIIRVKGFLVRLRDGLTRIYQKHEYSRFLVITLAIWLCVYTNYYFIVVGLGYKMTYFQVIVVSIIMIPLTLLPIQGFANFGTHEIGWVIAFSIFNQHREMALNVAFSTHILLLFFVLLLGACSYVLASTKYTKRILHE